MLYSNFVFAIVSLSLASLASTAPLAGVESADSHLSRRESYKGNATWFRQGGNAGSCGTVHQDSSLVIAMNVQQAGNNANCGRYIKIKNMSNGKTVTALVADTCPGCGHNSLDLSMSAFDRISSQSTGEVPISWHFV